MIISDDRITKHVPFEEVWQLEEAGRMLSVTTILETPLGAKRRTQLFTRVTDRRAPARRVLRLSQVTQPQNFFPQT